MTSQMYIKSHSILRILRYTKYKLISCRNGSRDRKYEVSGSSDPPACLAIFTRAHKKGDSGYRGLPYMTEDPQFSKRSPECWSEMVDLWKESEVWMYIKDCFPEGESENRHRETQKSIFLQASIKIVLDSLFQTRLGQFSFNSSLRGRHLQQ